MSHYYETINQILDQLLSLEGIDADSIPSIELYMDQITTFMENHLDDFRRHPDDKVLTKTMINNYAKNDLLPPPVKKKYSKDHILLLIFIYYLKSMLSISDIQILLAPLSDRYFNKKSPVNLEDIYKEVMDMEGALNEMVQSDISMALDLSSNMFTQCEEEEKEFLQLISFILYLSFDIYKKKQLLERLVDEIRGLNVPKKMKKDKSKGKETQSDKGKGKN